MAHGGRPFTVGRLALGLAVLPAVVLAPAAQAAVSPNGNVFSPDTGRETFLLSRSYYGGFPNGASRNVAFSGDAQLATRIAYESDASDIVPGDTNGKTDVFVVRRRNPYDRSGPPWRTQLVSKTPAGKPANGASFAPSLSGDQRTAPRCIAFVSRATNLVRGDTNNQPDAFVADLETGRITRVSVDSSGKQANGPTYDVSVDGECGRVAFTAKATNLALTRSAKPAWRSAVTTAPRAGTRQVYVHVLSDTRDNLGLGGLTFLASAAASRQAGNADSYEQSIARGAGGCPERCGDYFGESVAFSSDATNLSPRDTNGKTDIYRRDFTRTMRPLRPVSRAKPIGGLNLATRLVSVTKQGNAGNGPSRRPAANDRGDVIAFDTRASDLYDPDLNGVSDVVRALVTAKGTTVELVSVRFGAGNGDSRAPAITRPGSPIFFETDATNFNTLSRMRADLNGVTDIYFWNVVSREASLQSRDSEQQVLGTLAAPYNPNYRVPMFIEPAPTTNVATSYYGNYIGFETSNPLVDLKVARTYLPYLAASPGRAALESRERADLHQVYLRYIGPA